MSLAAEICADMVGDRSRQAQLRRWLDRWLPAVCLICGGPLCGREARACAVCWSRMPAQRHPRCPRCGIELGNTGAAIQLSSCNECAGWLPYLRAARSPYRMAGLAAAVVRALKYGGWESLAEEMGTRMAAVRFPDQVESEIAAVIAVPLSATRLRERGFNQSELLGRVLARQRGWRFLNGALARVRHTRRQARLSPGERAANVAGAFQVLTERRADVAERHLLLVDDVLTTAATAEDCVRALCAAGARAVSVLSFARARRDLTAEDR